MKSVLSKLPIGVYDKYVFLSKGRTIIDIRDGLKRGLEKIGLKYARRLQDGATLHDLRHTTKTLMRKAGVDRNSRMVIFGHSDSDKMDFRYDTIDDSDWIAGIHKLEDFISSNTDQTLTKIGNIFEK